MSDAEIPDYTFKYVITAPEATQSMTSDGINWENHDEVMDYLERNFDFGDGRSISR